MRSESGPDSRFSSALNSLRERPVVSLLVLGLLSEVVYLGYFVRTYPLIQYYRVDIDMGGITEHSTWGFWSFIAAFASLFLLLGGAWWVVHGRESRSTVWLILLLGAIFGVTMSFVYPVTAIDLYTYVDQSRIMVHYHQNPVFVPPSAFPADPWMQLADGWRNVGAPYGPIGIVLDALPMMLAGADLLLNLIYLKLLFTITTLVNGYLAYRITSRFRPEAALGSAVLVAWSPLLLFEISANGHNDGVMILVAMLGLYFVGEGSFLTGTVLLVASALVKYATGILLPLVVIHALSRLDNWTSRLYYLASTAAMSLAVAVIAYAPFWRGSDTFSRSLLENQLRIESFSSVVLDQLGTAISPDNATTFGRLLFLPLYLYALWLARGSFPDLLRGCFLALVGFLALAVTNFKIWYATWPAAFASAAGRTPERVAAVLLALGATISASFYGYLWVWRSIPSSDVNDLAYFIAFVPALIGLVAWTHGGRQETTGTPVEPDIATVAHKRR